MIISNRITMRRGSDSAPRVLRHDRRSAFQSFPWSVGAWSSSRSFKGVVVRPRDRLRQDWPRASIAPYVNDSQTLEKLRRICNNFQLIVCSVAGVPVGGPPD